MRLFIYMSSNGDGSASPLFFSSEERAEAYASHDDERFCDDIVEIDTDDLEIDPEPYK